MQMIISRPGSMYGIAVRLSALTSMTHAEAPSVSETLASVTARPRIIAPTLTPLMPSTSASNASFVLMPRIIETTTPLTTARPNASKIIGAPVINHGTIANVNSTPIGTKKSSSDGV